MNLKGVTSTPLTSCLYDSLKRSQRVIVRLLRSKVGSLKARSRTRIVGVDCPSLHTQAYT